MLEKHIISFIILIFIFSMISDAAGENLTTSNCSDIITCYDKGMQMLNNGNCSEAIEIFDKIINSNQSFIHEFDKSYSNVWLGKAKAEYCIQRYDITVQMCNNAISLNRNYTQFYVLKADALLREGRYKEAMQVFADIPKLCKSDGYILITMGDALSNNGMHREALEFYHKATDLQPANGDAWHRNASTLFLLGKYDDALVSYDRYMQLNSSDLNAFYERGIILSKLASTSCDKDIAIKRYQEAAYEFNKAIEMNPENYNASLQKGIMQLKLGQYENAIESFNKSIKQNRNSTSAWIGLGDALLRLKRCNDSLKAYENAIFLGRYNKKALLGMGDSFLCMNQFENALKEYMKALEMNHSDGESLERRAHALFLLGQDAYMSADLAIKDKGYASNCSRVWETYGDVLNETADDSDDLERAIEKYNNALQINEAKEIAPGDSTVNPSEIKRKIGLIYYQIGMNELPQTDEETLDYYNRFAEASEYFNKAAIYFNNLTERNINDSAAWLMLGQCYHRQWQYNKAIDCYERAANLNNVESLYRKAKDGMPHIRVSSFTTDNYNVNFDPFRIVFDCHLKLENLADVCGSAIVSISIRDIEIESSWIDVDGNSSDSKTIEVNVSKEEAFNLATSLADISLDILNLYKGNLEKVADIVENASKTELMPKIISQKICGVEA